MAESLPSVPALDRHLPVVSPMGEVGLGSFGEIELPREVPALGSPLGMPRVGGSVEVPKSGLSRDPSGDFDGLQLEDKPRVRGRSPSSAPSVPEANRTGGMTFGEVDFSSGQPDGAPPQSALSVVGPLPKADEPAGSPAPTGPAEVVVTAPARTVAARGATHAAQPTRTRPSSTGKRLALAGVVALVLAGAALQLTPYGAFGYQVVSDRVHARDFELALSATEAVTEKALGLDTYDQAKAAVDGAAAAHDRVPRARALTAYASLVDAVATVRFGADTARASRAKQLLAELPPDATVEFRHLALAAQAAADDELESARAALDAAGKAITGVEPARLEAALLTGYLALASQDGPAAVAAFKHALELSNDARSHFGLARAYDLVGDAANVKKEIEATLAASPNHPGALILRARMRSASTEESQAIRDLGVVIDGPARAKTAPTELSRAYAARAWVGLERGNTGEARDAFAESVRLDPRNVAALVGEGRLLLSEGRYTEALARFDNPLQIDPGSPEAIADDAEAKIALERLADAKQQLTGARERFPKSLEIMMLLGKVEQHLGNDAAAEADLRAAVTMAGPTERSAVEAYVMLSELLSARGRLPEAKAVLEEAKQRLAPSAALERALGDVAEQQGDHDVAIAHYRSAIAKEPRDLGAHFRLAVTFRRLRRFAEAGAELDKVVAVDKEYPGLSLERGLLFEESGDVEKAIAEFQHALAKAPNDPDLQLRVGSAYVAVGLPDDAAPMLRKVIQERPKSAEAYHYLGRALMLKGPSQQVEAMRTLKYAVDLDPNRAEYHIYLAWAANEAIPAQLELAHDEIDKALALDKLSAEIYWQKGVLERMEGSIDDAMKDERRALELRPSRYEAHATLAECYTDKNDEGAALSEWSKALAADADTSGPGGGVRHPLWRFRYGKLLMDRGNLSEALRWLLPAAASMEKSEQRPAWFAPLEFLTAEALAKSGQKKDALDHYQRFLDNAPVSSPDRAEATRKLAVQH